MFLLLAYLIGALSLSFLCSVLEAVLLSTPMSYISLKESEGAKNAKLKNVRFMVTGAEYLLKYFCESSVERIYLNFSCPYPKGYTSKYTIS